MFYRARYLFILDYNCCTLPQRTRHTQLVRRLPSASGVLLLNMRPFTTAELQLDTNGTRLVAVVVLS